MKPFLHAIFAVAFFASAQALADPQSNGSMEEGKPVLADLRTGTDLTKYRTVLFAPLVLPAEMSRAVPPGGFPEEAPTVRTTAGDVRRLQDAFSRSMRTVLWRNGLTVVTVPREDTLIVFPQVVKIVLNPQVNRGNYGIDYILARIGGSMELTAILADGTTQKPIAELADRAYAGDLRATNTRLIYWSDAGDVFDAWADDLSDTLRSR